MAWYLAIVAAFPVGGFMLDKLGIVAGIRWGLWVSIIVTIPIFFIRWKYIKETVNINANKAEGLRQRFSRETLHKVPSEIWKLILVATLSSFGFQAFWSYVVVYSIEEIGLSTIQWSYISMISNFAAACFMIPSGFLSDKVGRKQLIILSQFAVSLHTIGYVVSKSYNGIVGTRMLGSIGEGLGGNVMGSVGGPVWQALVTGVTSLETRGSVLGLMGTITGIITTPAPLIGGYLYETVSPKAPFLLNSVLGVIGCLIFTIWVNEPEKTEV